MTKLVSTLSRLLPAICVSCLIASSGAAAQEGGLVVVTSLQATYSLTTALAEGTGIRVENAPADGASLLSQERAFASDALDPVFAQAGAVVTIARVWHEDRLYPAARARNIHVVPVDAAWPWTVNVQPVALSRRPCSDAAWLGATECPDEISPYIWLSLSNGVRMAEHIATDLKRLQPDATDRIQANLLTLVSRLRGLKSEYDNRFVELADPRVFSLAEEFVYLFGEMGVFVDGNFLKEDVRWTAEDIAAFEAYLTSNGISVVVHKWEPSEPIKAAIERAGAKLVILDVGDKGREVDGRLDPDGYVNILRSDMDMLLAALAE